MKIDWNEAPEWAVAHALYTFLNQITPVWVGVDQWQDVVRGKPFPYGGGTGEARHNPTRAQFQYETPRPAPWNGEGRPPVGTVCEWKHIASDNWHQARVNYIGCAYVIFASHSGDDEQHYYLRDISFRKIRTPEQIAAEERANRIQEALTEVKGCRMFPGDIVRGNITISVVEAMIDAGYRKQVKP